MRIILSYISLGLIFSSSSLVFGQQNISPSGNTYNLNLTRWVVPSLQQSQGRTDYIGPRGSSPVVTYTAEFVPLNDMIVAPGWTGSFTATASAQNPGAASGFFFHYSSATDPLGYGNANLAGMNALLGNTLGATGYSFRDTSQTTITYDFSGLTYGYLPAGTVFFITDLDAFETSTQQGEGPITFTADLGLGNSNQFLDYLGTIDGSNPVQSFPNLELVWDASTNTYDIRKGEGGLWAQDSDLSIFVTTENIYSLTVSDYSVNAGVHAVMFSGQLSTVPEPSAAILAGFTAMCLLMRRSRTRV